MSDSRDREVPDTATPDAEVFERQKEFTRRALIRAGWVTPLVTTVNIPSASAQSPVPHNDTHGDSGHQDDIIIHGDVHLDTSSPPHTDHTDHTDVPHTDTPPHTDVPHTDTPPTFRTRTPHRTATIQMGRRMPTMETHTPTMAITPTYTAIPQ